LLFEAAAAEWHGIMIIQLLIIPVIASSIPSHNNSQATAASSS